MDRLLVLTASAGVPDALAEAAAAEIVARGGTAGPARRLAPGAVELPVAVAADYAPSLPAAVDANLVPAQGREKRLLIADMDSTIIGVECIDELADFAGVKPQVAAITERAMRGELDFESALRERVALLRGLPERVLQDCFDARVRLNPGARVLVRTMAARGAMTALISGGFTFFTARVAEAAGFARNQANRLGVADGALTGMVAEPILGRAAKLAALQALTAEAGLTPAAAVAVGDGANDLDMVRAAGLGVAYRAKPALAEAAGARLDHSDLTALLALQGIPATDWRD
ncbi:MAG: phosphoserine phosphatase SerB [Amaricoccus sp.]